MKMRCKNSIWETSYQTTKSVIMRAAAASACLSLNLIRNFDMSKAPALLLHSIVDNGRGQPSTNRALQPLLIQI